MNRRIPLAVLAAGLLAGAPARADALAAPEAARVFHNAAAAAEHGDIDAAVRGWQEILAAGWDGPEVHYNLGVCEQAAGQMGPAMRHLRRAWYDAPRDADIRTQMRRTAREAGAVVTEPEWPLSWIESASRENWLAAAAAAYLVAAALLGFRFVTRRWRRGSAAALMVAAAAAAGALAAAAHWASLRASEAVVMGSDLEFRIAPSAGAQAIARAPAGTIVRVDAADREWIRASAGQREGWVPRAALARVEDGR